MRCPLQPCARADLLHFLGVLYAEIAGEFVQKMPGAAAQCRHFLNALDVTQLLQPAYLSIQQIGHERDISSRSARRTLGKQDSTAQPREAAVTSTSTRARMSPNSLKILRSAVVCLPYRLQQQRLASLGAPNSANAFQQAAGASHTRPRETRRSVQSAQAARRVHPLLPLVPRSSSAGH